MTNRYHKESHSIKRQPTDPGQDEILAKLQQAGAKGLSKTSLKIGSSASKLKSFKELQKNKLIANLGSLKKTRYVLQQFYTPLELASAIIEKKVINSQTPGKPITIGRQNNRRNLLNALPAGAIRKKGDEAFEFLAKEKKLLRLSYGNSTYFIHVAALRSLFPSYPLKREGQTRKGADPRINHDKVLKAYHQISQHIGFSNIEIYELQQKLDVPMAELKRYIVQESKKGQAVLSFGDWSLSSEETRSGAIYLREKAHLMVRFYQ